ncbi:DUF1206 domain-containing protein [Alteromonas pelagimontana]|uniref:DUF1206 domain-containing protein n=1 Tax=Alteromonas pelagimontana TaxID=1858656 RepID=A0A6M4MD15_9ALTE|nr:DUF1206 domain-containing protein [Alteromonas pelagimontana]QJR80907.1 DUF1206 domain-containing protein [Alteromonas pelagimontana]
MQKYSQWIKYIARTGYGAKTIVYCLLGIFVIQYAFAAFRSDMPSQKDVFQKILQQPFGWFLLAGVIIGMVCYVFWRWIQTMLNTEGLDMSNSKDVIMRIFYFISGLIYAFGAFAAFKVLQGSSSQSEGGGDSSQQVSQTLMQQSWGVWLVAALGAIVVFFSFIQFKHAAKADFMDKFVLSDMSEKEKKASKLAGRLGFLARGIIYVLVGGFFIHSAMTADPDKAGGLKKAFSVIIEQTFGQWILGAVGAGIILFGVFCGFETLYRRTQKSSSAT